VYHCCSCHGCSWLDSPPALPHGAALNN